MLGVRRTTRSKPKITTQDQEKTCLVIPRPEPQCFIQNQDYPSFAMPTEEGTLIFRGHSNFLHLYFPV